jgi:NAD dependent epimerase/dehydratase family enzyme
MIIAVTGSTGLVGSALVHALEADGHDVRRLVRREVRNQQEIRWDPAAGQIDAAGLVSVDAVVHLAGENLAAHRWTDAFKEQIRSSRVAGTRLLCEALAKCLSQDQGKGDSRIFPRGLGKTGSVPDGFGPQVLCSASAIGYYGDRGQEQLDESSPPGHGFLPEVCSEWEAATDPARAAGMRVVNLRIGVVLSAHGGALSRMLPPFRMGVGGVIGSGRQVISWIALDDLVSAIQFVLANPMLTGPVNAVAPEPATNRELTKTLGRVLGRPTILPLPAFAARLAFGEMANELLLGGARVEPKALLEAGFSFAYPRLEPALRHVLGR